MLRQRQESEQAVNQQRAMGYKGEGARGTTRTGEGPGLCGVLLAACLGATAQVAGAADDADRGWQDDTLIELQIGYDMMQGTDDFFGENADLPYADSQVPAGLLRNATPQPAATTEVRKDASAQSSSQPAGPAPGTPTDTGPKPPAVDPPPAPDPEDPPPV